MTETLIVPLPGNEALADALATALGAEALRLETRRFPDGETYLRFPRPLCGTSVVLACTLARPDDKALPLLFAAETAHDLCAARVGLVAPYLAYMRQDDRFHDGEAITSRSFARLLSGCLDWLVTVDPHLHRFEALDEIYTMPARALHAAPLLSRWIGENVPRPLLIGPDAESEQWVAAVAAGASAPFQILRKLRHGDRDVEISVPDIERWRDHTPVLVDDIVSTGRTMLATIAHLRSAGLRPPVCLAVHGIFADAADKALLDAGAARVVTCNTIPHPTNAIDVTPMLGEACSELAGVRVRQPPPACRS